jgi:hypothetical protein
MTTAPVTPYRSQAAAGHESFWHLRCCSFWHLRCCQPHDQHRRQTRRSAAYVPFLEPHRLCRRGGQAGESTRNPEAAAASSSRLS